MRPVRVRRVPDRVRVPVGIVGARERRLGRETGGGFGVGLSDTVESSSSSLSSPLGTGVPNDGREGVSEAIEESSSSGWGEEEEESESESESSSRLGLMKS